MGSHKFTNPDNLTMQQLWCLSLSAPLVELNDDNHDILGTGIVSEKTKEKAQEVLSRAWGISTKSELLEQLGYLDTSKGADDSFFIHKQYMSNLTHNEKKFLYSDPQLSGEAEDNYSISSLVLNDYYEELADVGTHAWDEGRAIWLCRTSTAAGFFSKKETWKKINEIAKVCAARYDSWEQFGLSYSVGTQLWMSSDNEYKDMSRRIDNLNFLLFDQESPWQNIPWETGA